MKLARRKPTEGRIRFPASLQNLTTSAARRSSDHLWMIGRVMPIKRWSALRNHSLPKQGHRSANKKSRAHLRTDSTPQIIRNHLRKRRVLLMMSKLKLICPIAMAQAALRVEANWRSPACHTQSPSLKIPKQTIRAFRGKLTMQPVPWKR